MKTIPDMRAECISDHDYPGPGFTLMWRPVVRFDNGGILIGDICFALSSDAEREAEGFIKCIKNHLLAFDGDIPGQNEAVDFKYQNSNFPPSPSGSSGEGEGNGIPSLACGDTDNLQATT